MRKPRSDAKLANLPADQQEEIAAWCANDGLEATRAKLLQEHGITISTSSLATWHAWHRRQEALRLGNDRVAQMLEWFRKNRPNATPAEIRNATFLHLSLLHGEDPEMQLAILREQGKDLDRDLTTRRVHLLEEAAAKAKATLETLKAKGGLTPETLRTIEEAANLL